MSLLARLLLLSLAAWQVAPVQSPRDRSLDYAPAASIAGRITEQRSGRPLPGIVVTVATMPFDKRFEAITDADGGDYFVTAVARGESEPSYDERQTLTRLAETAERITLGDQEERTVDLRITATPEPRLFREPRTALFPTAALSRTANPEPR
jgi:hypothetical protein